MNKLTISKIVVVEGKTDTAKLKRLFNVTTIETNGSALDDKTINLIHQASKANGVILFLDPDHQGNKLRQTLKQKLINFSEAFIRKEDCLDKKKIGIAEASDNAIVNALANLKDLDLKKTSLSWNDYLDLNLNNKAKRNKISEQLNIPYFNHKQLFKMLNAIGIDKEQVRRMINE